MTVPKDEVWLIGPGFQKQILKPGSLLSLYYLVKKSQEFWPTFARSTPRFLTSTRKDGEQTNVITLENCSKLKGQRILVRFQEPQKRVSIHYRLNHENETVSISPTATMKDISARVCPNDEVQLRFKEEPIGGSLRFCDTGIAADESIDVFVFRRFYVSGELMKCAVPRFAREIADLLPYIRKGSASPLPNGELFVSGRAIVDLDDFWGYSVETLFTFHQNDLNFFWFSFSKRDWPPVDHYSHTHFRAIGRARTELSRNPFFTNFLIAFLRDRTVLDDSCPLSADSLAVRCLIVKIDDRVDYLPAPANCTVGDVLAKLPQDQDWALMFDSSQGRIDPQHSLEDVAGQGYLKLTSKPSQSQAQVRSRPRTHRPVSAFRKDDHNLFLFAFSERDWQPARHYSHTHFRTIGDARTELSRNPFFKNFFVAFVCDRTILDDSCPFSADSLAVRCLIVNVRDSVAYLPAPPKCTVGDALAKLPTDWDWALISSQLPIPPQKLLADLAGPVDLRLMTRFREGSQCPPKPRSDPSPRPRKDSPRPPPKLAVTIRSSQRSASLPPQNDPGSNSRRYIFRCPLWRENPRIREFPGTMTAREAMAQLVGPLVGKADHILFLNHAQLDLDSTLRSLDYEEGDVITLQVSFWIQFSVEAIVPLTFALSFADSHTGRRAAFDVLTAMSFPRESARFYGENGEEVMNTDDPIWVSMSPPSFPIRIAPIEPIRLIFLRNGILRAQTSQRQATSTVPTATIAVFWNGSSSSCPKMFPLLFRESLSLNGSRNGYLLTSETAFDCFAIPVVRCSGDSIELACANPIKLIARVREFTLEGRQFFVDVNFCENSELVETNISAMLGQEVRLDPSIARNCFFKDHQDTPIPLVPHNDIPANAMMFTFQQQTKAVSIDGLTVSEIESRLSEEFGKEVEIDRTAVAVICNTVLIHFRHDFPSPIRVVPLAEQFCRVSICREETQKRELHQFLKSTTVGEMKVLLCPDAHSREVELQYEGKVHSDNETLDEIKIRPGIPFSLRRVCVGRKGEKDAKRVPWDAQQLSLNAARRASRDDRLPSVSKLRFHFGPDDDVVLKFDSSATVADACLALSDIRHAAFPPLALFYNGNELDDGGELLSNYDEIYVGRSSEKRRQCVVELPSGSLRRYERKPVRDLRLEIRDELGVDVDLLLHGMLLQDSDDLRDKFEEAPIEVVLCPMAM
jgi:hypothetical protein